MSENSSPHDVVQLAQVPRAVLAQTGKPVSYRRIYLAILDGLVPAEQRNGRWHLSPETIEQIPKLLRLAA